MGHAQTRAMSHSIGPTQAHTSKLKTIKRVYMPTRGEGEYLDMS